MSSKSKNTQILLAGLVAAAAVGIVLYYASTTTSTAKELTTSKKKNKKKLDDDDNNDEDPSKKNTKQSSTTTTGKSIDVTPKKSNLTDTDEKLMHSKIEELDKQGKALFKNKKFLEAAAAFTEALDYIESHTDASNPSSSLNKQIVTLINNRSAMYEKGNLPELAIEDCNRILDVYDISHSKARQRKLRILETKYQDYYQALVECCALQLLYMQQHRDQLRMGLPATVPPPVPQSKLEELVQQLIPQQLDEYFEKAQQLQRNNPRLPADFTLSQLLKSYTGYNSWMAKAAKDGPISKLRKLFESMPKDSNEDETVIADKASLLMKMGRRYVYDGTYSLARETILKAYALVDGKPKVQAVMKDDDYARLLEWTGMVKHWTYDLQGADECYQKCADLEPTNAEVLVKQAGVAMDASDHQKALALFETALKIDPDAIDALLHRANLRMLQTDVNAAKADLERCVELRPDYVMAHLRLAAVLTSMNDAAGAQKHLDAAQRVDPESSDVQSYRGEVLFTQNEFAEAKRYFEKAMKLEPKNPTPYVNTALAVLNTPPPPGRQMEMAQEAIGLLQKAIEVDPQFQAAYLQLCQLKLGMATDLGTAKEVVDLYDQGLSYCRTKEEMKDMVGMKILTQAQVDGAAALKMETFQP